MIDFDNIKYIFQIPLVWYTDITAKVCKAYGQNFIRVKDGEDGGLEIGVDDDSFAQYVQQYITGGGTVKSVDGVPPDASGNVNLGALTNEEADAKYMAKPESGTATIASLKVITDVVWTGTTLNYKSRTLKITNGLIESATPETTTTIDTPHRITWS